MLKIHALLVSSTRFDAKSWLHSRRIMERLQCNLLFFFQWTSEVFLINFRSFFFNKLINISNWNTFIHLRKQDNVAMAGRAGDWTCPKQGYMTLHFTVLLLLFDCSGQALLRPLVFMGFFYFSSHLSSPLLSYQHLRVFKQMPAQQLCVPVRVSTMQHGQTPGSRRSSRLDLS